MSDLAGKGNASNLSFSQLWKSGISGGILGVAEGYLGTPSSDGGAGLKDSHVGSFIYADFISISKSIATNISNDEPLLSKINIAAGPITITVGQGQALIQASPNIGLIANVVNYGYGGVTQLVTKGPPTVTWGFTSSGATWTTGGLIGNFNITNDKASYTSGILGFLNKIHLGSFHPSAGNLLGNIVEPPLGNVGSTFAPQDAW